jgi:hypothetical protein
MLSDVKSIKGSISVEPLLICIKKEWYSHEKVGLNQWFLTHILKLQYV